ncbi:DUF2842 domain-containing protein [Sphingosinicella microcystinivorans]|uniref:DUF2842 domain-containing protein n=1 Tax=Sphingosinicella microcystinivorans TaxID=335406 RepID=UPI001C6A9DC0|nr:DUF2842 domain-containing protein [Sphingosinicella microcystinivorans]MBW7947116.1 DUF2842 domain-containing protein [Sphingomonadaceae bacterium]WBX83432.1 DUF2842 domain-containing protein [Sphingosinicella microcystinivorans]
MTDPKPSLRKPFGVLLLILLIALYALAAVAVAEPVTRLPALVQLPVWVALGIAWVFPARPLVRWIETGRFRK